MMLINNMSTSWKVCQPPPPKVGSVPPCLHVTCTWPICTDSLNVNHIKSTLSQSIDLFNGQVKYYLKSNILYIWFVLKFTLHNHVTLTNDILKLIIELWRKAERNNGNSDCFIIPGPYHPGRGRAVHFVCDGVVGVFFLCVCVCVCGFLVFVGFYVCQGLICRVHTTK